MLIVLCWRASLFCAGKHRPKTSSVGRAGRYNAWKTLGNNEILYSLLYKILHFITWLTFFYSARRGCPYSTSQKYLFMQVGEMSRAKKKKKEEGYCRILILGLCYLYSCHSRGFVNIKNYFAPRSRHLANNDVWKASFIFIVLYIFTIWKIFKRNVAWHVEHVDTL